MNREELERRLKEYRESLQSMNSDRWLGEFAEDAVLEDPVGATPSKGHAQMRTVYEGLCKMLSQLHMKADFEIAIPPEAAVKWSAAGETAKGVKVAFEGISHFRFRDDGKILHMRVFWDIKNFMRQLKA